MIVCHCMQVNDRMVRAVVRGGAKSCEQVAEACGAGACCGGCRPHIEQLVGEEQTRPRRSSGVHLALLPAGV
jgi:bacterioferritin-associated ferredoxin